jgi:hypothetical protein
MDTKIVGTLVSRLGRTLSGRAARSTVVIGVVGCLAVGGFVVAVTGAGAALSAQTPIATISVNHTNKGDRLPLALKRSPVIPSPTVSTLPRPPIGCDPAFSRSAEPERAHIFGRCIS